MASHPPPVSVAFSRTATAAPLTLDGKEFPYRSDGKGILYHLGRAAAADAAADANNDSGGAAGSGSEWVNPATAGVVRVSASSEVSSRGGGGGGGQRGSLSDVVDFCPNTILRPEGCGFSTANRKGSWVEVTLPVALHLRAYQFSVGCRATRSTGRMRNWVLYGTHQEDNASSGEQATWYPLATHVDDKRMDGTCYRGAWKLRTQQRFGFHRFRIVGAPFATGGGGGEGVDDEEGVDGEGDEGRFTLANDAACPYAVQVRYLELFGTVSKKGEAMEYG